MNATPGTDEKDLLEDRQSIEAIAIPLDPKEVAAEIERLPATCRILGEKRFEIYVARASRIPKTLFEICRLREVSFREVGEGTGNAIDRDDFDDHYRHLFLWDFENRAIAGAYRMGLTDEILGTHGAGGLYCSSLFNFEPEFLDFLNPAIELGRSFIAPDYQRMIQPLALLWKGICQFALGRKSPYQLFYGPVSISQDYTSISKNLIVEFMERQHRHPTLANLVTPKNPFPSRTDALGELDAGQISEMLSDVRQVSARIAECEPDGKGIPVLLRHYLKMNATLLSFNVDPAFSNALDALLLTDLTQAPAPLVKLYCGHDGARLLLGDC